jgi:hypothetical protein
MHWFGEPWPSAELRAPVCEDDSLRVPPPPPGEECILCGHPIEPGDRGIVMPHARYVGSGMFSTELRYNHIECMHSNVGGVT